MDTGKRRTNQEFDIKFLVREFNLTISDIKIAKKYVSEGEFSEVEKIVNSVRK